MDTGTIFANPMTGAALQDIRSRFRKIREEFLCPTGSIPPSSRCSARSVRGNGSSNLRTKPRMSRTASRPWWKICGSLRGGAHSPLAGRQTDQTRLRIVERTLCHRWPLRSDVPGVRQGHIRVDPSLRIESLKLGRALPHAITEQTCGRCRCFWVTAICPRRRSILTSPARG
jgi:hypothetical protein